MLRRQHKIYYFLLIMVYVATFKKCTSGLVANHILKRCWSDVPVPITSMMTQGSTTCFHKNREEAICYELKTKVDIRCEPPWEDVLVYEPATIDHLAMALVTGTNLNFFPAVIVGNSLSSGFLNFFTENSECSSVRQISKGDIRNDSCALILKKPENDYYETHFVHDSCNTVNDDFACSKVITLDSSTVLFDTTTKKPPTSSIISTDTSSTTEESSNSSQIVTLEMYHIVIIAAVINILIISLIVSICCCYFKKSNKKSLLITGSFRNSSRPLPTPDAIYKPSQSESEYFYPTMPEFQTSIRESERMVESSALTFGTRAASPGMNNDPLYMGLGETVSEHQQSVTANRRQNLQRQDQRINSYLELEENSVSQNTKYTRPLTHTYADLNYTTEKDQDGYQICNGQVNRIQAQGNLGDNNCYMGLNEVHPPHAYMDVSVYKGLCGHIVPSGCTRQDCADCETARLIKKNESTIENNKPAKITDDTQATRLYQEVEPAFYMAVEGKPRVSCEIGSMAKCFEDTAYSFLS